MNPLWPQTLGREQAALYWLRLGQSIVVSITYHSLSSHFFLYFLLSSVLLAHISPSPSSYLFLDYSTYSGELEARNFALLIFLLSPLPYPSQIFLITGQRDFVLFTNTSALHRTTHGTSRSSMMSAENKCMSKEQGRCWFLGLKRTQHHTKIVCLFLVCLFALLFQYQSFLYHSK